MNGMFQLDKYTLVEILLKMAPAQLWLTAERFPEFDKFDRS